VWQVGCDTFQSETGIAVDELQAFGWAGFANTCDSSREIMLRLFCMYVNRRLWTGRAGKPNPSSGIILCRRVAQFKYYVYYMLYTVEFCIE